MTTIFKICSKCDEKHDISAFTGKNAQCVRCIASYQKEWYENNKDRKKEQCKRLYDKNKDAIRARHREYNNKNRERVRATVSQWYKAALKGEKGEKTYLKIKVRHLIKNVMKYQRFSKTSTTALMLGCSYDELLEFMGSRPSSDHHIDHVCPCSQAQNEEELIKLQHYTNLQWLLGSENLSKSDNKTPEGEAICIRLLGREWQD